MFERFQTIVNSHIQKATGAPALMYDAMIKMRGITVTVLKVHSVIQSSNFLNDLATITHVTIAIPYSQMRLLSTKANGDLSVKLLTKINGKTVSTINYKGVVVNNRDPDMESQTMFLGESDDKSIALVTLELMEEAMWLLRLRQVGGIYHGTDGLTLARKIIVDSLPNESATLGNSQALTYDQEEQQLYRDIVVPDSVYFMDVFDHLQEHYGIYSLGLGVFLYLGQWFIFRPFDKDKFTSSKQKLVIYNLPREQAGHLDRTTHLAGDVRYIITGGDTLTNDRTDQDALNSGTGYRVGSIRALDGRASSFTPGGVSVTTPDKFVSQAAPMEHASGLTNAPVGKNHFKDDDKAIRSKIAQRTGQLVKVTWNLSMAGIVRPGMGVKFMWANDVGIYTRYGVVIGEVFNAAIDGNGMASARYNTQSEISIWLYSDKITS